MAMRGVPKRAVILKGLVFKLGIKKVTGRIGKQGDLNCFSVPGQDIFSMLLFTVPEDLYGKPVDAWVRTYDNSVVMNPGVDDLPVDQFDSDNRFHDMTDIDELGELYETVLIKRVPELLSSIRYTIGSVAVSLIAFLSPVPNFPFAVVPLMLALYCGFWAIREYHAVASNVVYDAVGNWINLSTGKSSLNKGSFTFKVDRE